MPTIDLVYFNAGGGHRASALALQAAIAAQGWPWQVRLVNLTALLDPRDTFRRLTGFGPEDLYNRRLARGWTFGLSQELRWLQRMIRVAHPSLVRVLQRHWLRTEPDLVVSLIPNFNRALCQSLAQALPGVPYLTVMTDLADHPPHFWIEPDEPRQQVVCGTPRAFAQAVAMGVSPTRLHRVDGMLLRPDFHRPPIADRTAARAALGFDPTRPIGLVLFGGQGSNAMRGIARQLADVQTILVCGHHDALARHLRAALPHAPHRVLGFVPDIAALMQCADFFIGKPGPGSVSEAVQQRLPVIVVRNRWTMPQERYNADWIVQNGLGVVLPRFRDVREAVDRVIADAPAFADRLARVHNRAAEQVPRIIADRLAHPLGRTPQAWPHCAMR